MSKLFPNIDNDHGFDVRPKFPDMVIDPMESTQPNRPEVVIPNRPVDDIPNHPDMIIDPLQPDLKIPDGLDIGDSARDTLKRMMAPRINKELKDIDPLTYNMCEKEVFSKYDSMLDDHKIDYDQAYRLSVLDYMETSGRIDEGFCFDASTAILLEKANMPDEQKDAYINYMHQIEVDGEDYNTVMDAMKNDPLTADMFDENGIMKPIEYDVVVGFDEYSQSIQGIGNATILMSETGFGRGTIDKSMPSETMPGFDESGYDEIQMWADVLPEGYEWPEHTKVPCFDQPNADRDLTTGEVTTQPTIMHPFDGFDNIDSIHQALEEIGNTVSDVSNGKTDFENAIAEADICLPGQSLPDLHPQIGDRGSDSAILRPSTPDDVKSSAEAIVDYDITD